jgi:hypothetical protein
MISKVTYLIEIWNIYLIDPINVQE